MDAHILIIHLFFLFTYQLIAAVCNSAFGPKYYSANFGLLFTTTFVYNTFLIVFTQVGFWKIGIQNLIFLAYKVPILINTLHFTGMFLVAGGAGFIGVIITAFIPKNIKF